MNVLQHILRVKHQDCVIICLGVKSTKKLHVMDS